MFKKEKEEYESRVKKLLIQDNELQKILTLELQAAQQDRQQVATIQH